MSVKQKVCIWIGIAAFVLIGILPPWVYRLDSENSGAKVRVEASAGYSFLTSPPELRKPWNWDRSFTAVSIDVTRLLIQWAMVVVLVGGLVFTLEERRII